MGDCVDMVAKKNSRCFRCYGAIHPGDKIRWSRVTGAAHSDCSGKEHPDPWAGSEDDPWLYVDISGGEW